MNYGYDCTILDFHFPFFMSPTLHSQVSNVISKSRSNLVAGIASCMRIVVRRVEDQVVHAIFTADDKINHIEWSPNGALILAVVASQGIVQIWSVEDLDWSARIDTGVTGLSVAHFHPTSNMHVLVYSEFGIRMDVWNLQTHSAGHIRNVKEDFIPVIDVSGRYALLVCREDCKDRVLVIDISRDDELKFQVIQEVPVLGDISGLEWTSDSKGFMVWQCPLKSIAYSVDLSHQNNTTSFNLYSSEKEYQLGAREVVFSRITSLLCIGGYDGHIRIFCLYSPDLVKQLADFSLDGDTLAIVDNTPIVLQESLSGDASLRERNVYQAGGSNPSNHPVEYREMIPDESAVESVSIIHLPGSNQLAPFSHVEGKASLMLGGPRAGICKLCLSPDGRYLVAQTETKSSVLFAYDLSILSLIAVLVHRHPVRDFTWNPSGIGSRNELAIATGDTKIFLWSPSQISQTIELMEKSFKPTKVNWNRAGDYLIVSDSERMTTIPVNPDVDRSGG